MNTYDFSFLNNLGLNKLTDRDYTIVKYVAHFYEVKIETIKTILKRNYHIFVDNGYEVLSGSTLNECKKNNQNHFSSMTSTIGLLNNKCVVIFAYFLRKSNKTLTIIKENDIRNHEFHEKIMGLYTSNDFVKKYEKEMGFLIHSIFDKFHKIEEQVSCGGVLYRFRY